jgi:protocatechuate 3,4-dioxygenase beta subunit
MAPAYAPAMSINTHHPRHGDGLHEDLVKLATRRDALRIFGAGSVAAILGTLGASNALAALPTGEVPGETAGPFPGDGSNGADVLDESGIVRHDIRSSFGDSRTLARGVPLRVNLTVTDASNDYSPLAGLAVYLWHCDRSGRYSMYSSGVEDENYLRGIAKTDAEGTAWFHTVFPGCYPGRWPHIHFEVYASVTKAVSNGPIVKTSQIALPQAVCRKVYATSGYSGSLSNLASTSLSTDMVFGDDNAIHQLATVTGSVRKGFVANLTIGI